MPEKPDVEALLPVLIQIAKDRPDIISVKEFRKILVDLGLALEKAVGADETKSEKSIKNWDFGRRPA